MVAVGKFRAKAKGRTTHITRAPDIFMGSLINGTKRKARELALRQKLVLAESRTKFNDVIRANSPTIYLLDPDLIARSIIDALISESGKNQYISTINRPEEGPSSAENQDFEQAFEYFTKQLPNLEKVLAAAIRQQLINSFPKVSSEHLLDLAQDIYLEMIGSLEKAASKSKKVYADFRAAAAKAGASVRRELNNIGVSILSDAEIIATNLNNRIPFVGFTFDTAVSKINSVIQKTVNEEIKRSGIVTIKEQQFKVGNLVHAGHVGIYEDRSLLGINMPSGIIAGIATNKLEQIEQAIGSIPLHIEHGIQVTKEFSEISGVFLDLQFNFAVSMQATINSAILGPQEQQAIRSVVGAITDEALFATIQSRVGAEAFRQVAEVLPEGESSQTLTEFIQNLIGNSIAGTRYPDFSQKTPKFPGTPVVSPGVNLPTKIKKLNKVAAPSKTKPAPLKIPAQEDISLSSLLVLLNSQLAEQIRKNMGTGSRKDILNYRTGRFAESVKIEKFSRSRQGMITAFYSYMKNPYATFTSGGRQELPRTRDPKLLISKSIRGLVAERVANKLRAVSI